MNKINLTIISWGFPRRLAGAEKELIDIAKHINKERFHVNLCGWYPQANLKLHDELVCKFREINFIDGLKNFPRHVDEIMATSDIILQFGKDHDGSSFLVKSFPGKDILFVDMLSSERSKIDKNYDVVYCVCEYLMNFHWVQYPTFDRNNVFEWHYGYDKEEIRTISEDLRDEIRSQIFGVSKNEIVLGYIGRLQSFKRVDILIDVVNTLNKYPVKLIIVGEGKEKDNLKRISNNINIGFRDWSENVEELLQSMDIFLFVSENEGLPKSLNEAMRCGLPIVTTDPGDVKQMCYGSFGVRIVDMKKREDVVEKIAFHVEDLINLGEHRKAMGKQNQIHIKEFNKKYTMENFENTIIKYREKILN